MLNQTLNTLFQRDLEKLKVEIESYQSEGNIWVVADGISNSSGNLALHLIGNLNHFFGKNVGNTGYVRDRPAEFASKNIPKEKLLADIVATQTMLAKVFVNMDPSKLETIYPERYNDMEVTHEQIFVHLYGHFTYHLGQINYHRRLLDK